MEWRPMNPGALFPWDGRRLWLGGLSMEGVGLMAELMPEGGPGPWPQPPGLSVPHYHYSAADPGSPSLQPHRCPGWCLMGQFIEDVEEVVEAMCQGRDRGATRAAFAWCLPTSS